MTSAKGAPGATTVAALMTWAWPVAAGRRGLLVEADPAGGSVVLELYGGVGRVPAGQGLLAAALDARHGLRPDELGRYVTRLDESGKRLLLAGLTDPMQAQSLQGSWPTLAGLFAGLAGVRPPIDVVADCGRLGAYAAPAALLTGPDLLLLVVRPTLVDVAAAQARIAGLRASFAARVGAPELALVVVGDGSYRPAEITDRTGVAVLGTLPQARGLAREGLRVLARPGYERSPVGRAAHQLTRAVIDRLRTRARAATATGPAALPPGPAAGSPTAGGWTPDLPPATAVSVGRRGGRAR